MNKYVVWALVVLIAVGLGYWMYQEGKKKGKTVPAVIPPGANPLTDPAETESGNVVE